MEERHPKYLHHVNLTTIIIIIIIITNCKISYRASKLKKNVDGSYDLQRNMRSWVVVEGATGLLMSCVIKQQEGGANPTESMTRALISDDYIARQSTLGPVQLGYVSHEST